MIDVAILTTTAWTMLQPYLPILVTKAVEGIGSQVPKAIGQVWGTIVKKFDTRPTAKEALEDLQKTPDNPDAQASFRQQLKKAMAEDESFATELSRLLEAAGDSYEAKLEGDGAIAQGPGAKAVGRGGVMIGGDVSGSSIITGNENSVNTDEKKKK
jgi:hypothetical protein